MLITLLMVVITMIHFKKPFYFKTEIESGRCHDHRAFKNKL